MANDDLQLLHNFIHDLKAPLSSAKSFIDLLMASGELNSQQRHFAHRAQHNMDRMNKIINTLLDYARLEARDELHVDVCDLIEILENADAVLEGMVAERQVTLQTRITPDAQFVQAEENLLESVLINLIGNAIKYNRMGGSVTVTSELNGQFIKIRVQDTGLGIPEADLNTIFERFYRVESKDHRQIEGTGIGLAIVKTVIEKHGGEIGVESVLGEGSTFYFTLPHASTSSPDYDREPADGLADDLQEDNDKHDDYESGELPH
ncbi:MAG: sensor histidine kinase [Anaerolineae bacterium]